MMPSESTHSALDLSRPCRWLVRGTRPNQTMGQKWASMGGESTARLKSGAI